MICKKCGTKNGDRDYRCKKCKSTLYHSRLKIENDDATGQTYLLRKQNYTIGRDMGNDIIIADTSVSRFHAKLLFQDNHFFLHDLNSKNGSFVNNYHIKKQPLRPADRIQLGHVVLSYHNDDERLLANNALNTEILVQKEFFKLSENRSTKLTTDDVLKTMLDLMLWLLHADFGMLFQANEQNKLHFKIGRSSNNKTFDKPDLQDDDWILLNDVIRSLEIQTDRTRSKTGGSNVINKTWNKLAIPLTFSRKNDLSGNHIGRHALLGICYIRKQAKTKAITQNKFDLLKTISQQIALAMENDILYRKVANKEKLHFQLALAKDIQKHLLPTKQLNIKHLDVAYFSKPCDAVSGDYFDIIPTKDDKVSIAIGDICGKGMPAALLSSTVRAAIRAQLEYSTSPAQIIQNLNRLFINSTAESIFFTLFFAILDVKTCSLTYINAGHPPPILLNKKSAFQELKATTVALGIIDEEIQDEVSIPFQSEDFMIMYTDGIIESQNSTKSIYGRKRLLNFIQASLTPPEETRYKPKHILQQIMVELENFTNHAKQSDDLTLVAVKRL